MSRDTDAYCARIGYSGPREPTLAVLRAIIAGHTAAIPFENLDVLAKRPIRLDTRSLYAKLVRQRRGGYCYEHNLLLHDVLLALGFRAGCLAARVHRSRPPGVTPPRGHCLLRVDLAGTSHLVDVGFGTAPTAPLALDTVAEQATAQETFRLVPVDGEFDLQIRFGEDWTDLYRLSLQPYLPVDYEAWNWFTSTHPDSLFVRNLIVTRPGPNRRSTLFNDKLTTHHTDGRVERRRVEGATQFRDALALDFGIAPPDPILFEIAAAVARERASQPDFFEPG